MVEKITPKKALGQNFLKDLNIAQLMVESIKIEENDQIIEIGSGTGALTKFLAPACKSKQTDFTAVEFDIDLIEPLRLAVGPDVEIVNANIMNYLDELKLDPNRSFKLIGSLPYNITSPLLHRIIKPDLLPVACVFLIQKEVAQKISACAPKSNYLSVFVQSFYDVEILKVVDKSQFSPIPKVDGTVIKLTRKFVDDLVDNVSRYEKFLHHCFSNPRKMLKKVLTAEELALYKMDGTKRPQEYDSGDYLEAFALRQEKGPISCRLRAL